MNWYKCSDLFGLTIVWKLIPKRWDKNDNVACTYPVKVVLCEMVIRVREKRMETRPKKSDNVMFEYNLG